MTWAEAIDCRYLEDLPFKIELNEFGQLVMTPRTNHQSFLKSKIASLLFEQNTSGTFLFNCCVQTAKSVKVADVVWMSQDFRTAHSSHREIETPLTRAPELCVEVVYPEDYPAEQQEKRELYFERGAQEVWFCLSMGAMRFFNRVGEVESSALFTQFPTKIELDN